MKRSNIAGNNFLSPIGISYGQLIIILTRYDLLIHMTIILHNASIEKNVIDQVNI